MASANGLQDDRAAGKNMAFGPRKAQGTATNTPSR
jgi:hypothetical protein